MSKFKVGDVVTCNRQSADPLVGKVGVVVHYARFDVHVRFFEDTENVACAKTIDGDVIFSGHGLDKLETNT